MVNNFYILGIIISLSITILLLIVQHVFLRLKNIILSNELFQKEVDHTNQIKFLLDKINSEDSVENEVQEGFVNFLNQSREWAFEYIETVQKTIKELVDVADKQMAFAVKYHNIDPMSEHMVKLAEPYYKLKALLPEEGKDDAFKR